MAQQSSLFTKSRSPGLCTLFNILGFILAFIIIVALAALLILKSSESTLPECSTNEYTAAVVEYVPFTMTSNHTNLTVENVLRNVGSYGSIISDCAKQSVDIIVFPECGLVGCVSNGTDRATMIEYFAVTVPSVEAHETPCKNSNYSQILSSLSCSAQENKMYVVVNLLEKVICSSNASDTCPAEQILLFNTDVVFDRAGQVIARYRKFNLYTERQYGVNATVEPELITFTTDFGETFGIIICFDIIFKQPSYDLIHKMNVTAMVFSAAVYSQLPFLALTSLGFGWSYAMNTTLLLSDLAVTYGGFGGSAIYRGRGDPLKVLMQEHTDSRVLIAKIPKTSSIPNQPSNLDYSLMEQNISRVYNNSVFIVDPVLDKFTNLSLEQNKANVVSTVYSNSFFYKSEHYSCKIDIIWDSANSSTVPSGYKFVSYSGLRDFTTASFNNYIEACGLILCNRSEMASGKCGQPPVFEDASRVQIMSLNILMISNVTTSIVMPATLDAFLYPISVSKFSLNSSLQNISNSTYRVVTMSLLEPVSNLVTFAGYMMPQESMPDPRLLYSP